MDFASELHRLVAHVEQGLATLLPPNATRPARLHEAMRYSLQAGGKRLRPVLLLASADMCGAPGQRPGPTSSLSDASRRSEAAKSAPRPEPVGHLDEMAQAEPGHRSGLQQSAVTGVSSAGHRGEVGESDPGPRSAGHLDEVAQSQPGQRPGLQGAPLELALPAAVAIECLHTYSLIHDDLPCMDDDDLRRGRPTVHKAFDEATALLAGDALLTHAFALLADAYAAQPVLAIQLIRELGDAAGSRRLIGGQMEDLLAEKKTDATADDLEFIHLNKTAAMIEAALVMGGWIGLHARTAAVGARASRPHAAIPEAGKMAALPGNPPPEIAILRTVGRHLGLAFQIIDDVLDATSDSVTLGKTPGKDAKADKTTFVKLHGLERSREFAREHTAAARQALASLERDHAFLDALIESLVTRAK